MGLRIVLGCHFQMRELFIAMLIPWTDFQEQKIKKKILDKFWNIAWYVGFSVKLSILRSDKNVKGVPSINFTTDHIFFLSDGI